MKNKLPIRFYGLLIIAIVSCGISISANAQIPRIISYQGTVTDAMGNPIPDGQHTLVFSIYDSATAGNQVYTETQKLTVTKGVFSTYIGSVTPIPNTVTFDRPYFLGIAIDGGSELPRTPFSTSPYAFHAAIADSVSGKTFSLPFSDTVSSNNAAFVVTQTGNSSAISGICTNANGNGFSRGVVGTTYTNDKNASGVYGETFGTQSSGVFGISHDDPATSGVKGLTNRGTGVTAGASYGNALVAYSTSTDPSTKLLGNLALFQSDDGSGIANRARIDNTGKGFFNGGTQNSGADVAEAFDVTGIRSSYEPGDVLVISTEKDRTVEKSGRPYSTNVVGVYATKPGVLLTEQNIDTDLKDLVPMGVVGVIPTKVCTENGPIHRGDLLVTSSKTGYAMKAEDAKLHFGMVIGKALENFTGKNGKISVLVNVK